MILVPEVGDEIYCHKSLTCEHDKHPSLLAGCVYKVISLNLPDEEFEIINEIGQHHSFSINRADDSFYQEWFGDIKDLRKAKLKNLNENNQNS